MLSLVAALAATGASDLETVVRVLGQQAGSLPRHRRGFLLVLSENRGRLLRLGDPRARPVRMTLGSRDLRRLSSVRAGVPPIPGLPQGRFTVTFPLVSAGTLTGALVLMRDDAPFHPAEKRRLAPALPAIAASLGTLQRIEETEDRLYQLALVNAATRRMTARLALPALSREVIATVQSTFGFPHVALHPAPLPAPRGLAGYAARQAQPVVAQDVRVDPRALGAPKGVRSLLCLPMLADSAVFAVLELGSAEPSAFDRGTIVVLETLALQVGTLLRNAEHFGQARRETEKLRALLDTSRLVARAVESEDVLSVIAERAKALLRAQGCTIYRLLPDEVTLRPVIAREPRFSEEILQATLRVGKGIVGTAVRRGKPEVVNDAARDPRAQHVPGTPRLGRENLMVAPLAARGSVIGAMTLSRTPEPFTEEDLDLFSIFAGLAADTLFAAALHGEVRRAKDFLERVVDASADAIVTTDMDGRITMFSPGAEALFGYAAGEVMGRPVTRYYVNGTEEGRRLMRRLTRDERVVNHEIQFLRKDGAAVTCMMSASLLRDPKGQAIGTLGISKDITERVRLEARLLELTIEDDLTGLYNARHFWGAVDSEVRRAQRQEAPLALLLFDLDGFKRYNDAHGHLAGDRALRRVAASIRACIRADIDKAFRYGGDEFVVLLPGAGRDAARHTAERVRRRVKMAMRGELTVSGGLVELRRGVRDPRRLVREADDAMYRAKREGGDRIELPSPRAVRRRAGACPPPGGRG